MVRTAFGGAARSTAAAGPVLPRAAAHATLGAVPRGGTFAGARLRRGLAWLTAAHLALGCTVVVPGSHAAEPAARATAAPFAATPGSRHDFADVEHWRRVFDDPARDAWQKPRELVAALGLRPGAWVADLGAGTGYFSRHLDAAVGPAGVVFAVDTEPNLVAHLRTHRRAYLRRLERTLKPAGRIAIVDWHKHDLPVGPPPEHKLARAEVVDEMRIAGFRLVDEQALLPHQYFLVFARSAA
jgi:predicted methyltransferase